MQEEIIRAIHHTTGIGAPVKKITSVGGGSINDCRMAELGDQKFFIKINRADRYPGMFEKEGKGLDLLRRHSDFRIPMVFGTYTGGGHAFLVMEYIASGNRQPGFSAGLGHSLARMHQHQSSHYGLEEDNYIGSLKQSNAMHTSWISFFREERLEFMLHQAIDKGLLDDRDVRTIEKLSGKLDSFFPQESPALVHGDLWSGNYMCDDRGNPVIIDPAVYYGHRYMDLGMMQLFGGFDAGIFDHYNEAYPLEHDWREGTEVANLYPLLVHVNLFGGGYVSQLRSILQRFI